MRRSLGKAGAALAISSLLACTALASDSDGDGLPDDAERALLQRFAPLVLLHPSERALPGNAEWLLARAELEPAPGRPRPVLAASIVGAFPSPWHRPQDAAARLHPAAGTRDGSPDPREWIAYGHAFPAADRGVLLQYWFLYPFNDAYWVFDHEGDWEHVTVKLDDALHPEGAFYARHADASPGAWLPWSALAREGEHPVVLAARGTHASYASAGEPPLWDRVCSDTDAARAADAGCAVWRTWDAPGGVVDLGERAAPRVAFLAWPGRWGATGGFGVDSRTDPPPGPAFQPGWCAGAAPGSCPVAAPGHVPADPPASPAAAGAVWAPPPPARGLRGLRGLPNSYTTESDAVVAENRGAS